MGQDNNRKGEKKEKTLNKNEITKTCTAGNLWSSRLKWTDGMNGRDEEKVARTLGNKRVHKKRGSHGEKRGR